MKKHVLLAFLAVWFVGERLAAQDNRLTTLIRL